MINSTSLSSLVTLVSLTSEGTVHVFGPPLKEDDHKCYGDGEFSWYYSAFYPYDQSPPAGGEYLSRLPLTRAHNWVRPKARKQRRKANFNHRFWDDKFDIPTDFPRTTWRLVDIY